MRSHLLLALICLILSFQSAGKDMTIEYSESVVPLDAQPVSVKGIWSMNLEGVVITSAIDQAGQRITGSCKSNNRNGVIAGRVSKDRMDMALALLDGGVLISIYMSGKVSGDAINGEYIQMDNNGSAASGIFVARRVSSDTSGYTPVRRGVTLNRTEYIVSPASSLSGMISSDLQES